MNFRFYYPQPGHDLKRFKLNHLRQCFSTLFLFEAPLLVIVDVWQHPYLAE